MEFKVGDTIGKDEEKLLRAHLKSDQDEMDKATNKGLVFDIQKCVSLTEESLKTCGIRTEYVAEVLSSMTDKLEGQRMYCAAKGIPMFAPPVCHTCGRSWTTSTLTGKSHVTGCPYCRRSWYE